MSLFFWKGGIEYVSGFEPTFVAEHELAQLEADQPALSQKDLTGLTEHWIEVGQPYKMRLLRVCSRSQRVSVYGYAANTPEWWAGMSVRLSRLDNLMVWQIPSEQSRALAKLASRSMSLQATMQERTLWVEEGELSVGVVPLQRCPKLVAHDRA